MEQTFMKEKKILPLVITMSLPMVISMAVNSLYNIVDSFFVAKLSENAMTALSLVFPIQNLVNSIAVGIGIGINATVAFHLGAGNPLKANRTASLGVLVNLIHGIILTVLCQIGMPYFLRLFTSNTEILNMADTYSSRVFLFTIMITLGICYEKIFQSVGRMKVSMFSMICGFVTNIILDPLMIFGIGIFPKLGIAGAAYATGIGQMVSLAVYLVIYTVRPLPVKIQRRYMTFDKELLTRIYGIGIPATCNMALPSLLISVLNGILSTYGDIYVLVLGAYYKLQTFIYLSANGVIQGIRPLVSYNHGAGEHMRVKKIYTTALKLTVSIMAVGTVLSWLIPEQLMGLFTSNPDTIQIGITAIHIISLGFAISAVSVTTSGSLEGLGMGLSSLCIASMRYFILIVPLAFLFSRFGETTGVWAAFPVTEFTAALISYRMYRKNIA